MTVHIANATPTARPRSVLDLFDEAVARAGNASALRHGARAMSYDELDAAVDTIAAALAARGVAPGASVAIVMATGIDYVVAMLAILRAGAAYIPLAPTLPAARIARMLELAQCRHALFDAAGEQACDSLPVSMTRSAFAELASTRSDGPCLRVAPTGGQLACILFTSGSTGDPKGVRTLHGNLAYYADWSRRFFAESASSRVPLTAAPHYAAATSQIYACLCAGATLHILDGAIAEPRRLQEFFRAHPGYALHCVPTVWRALLDRLENDADGMPAALFLSGEALPQALLDRTFALAPALAVWNLYGPTECVANISVRRLARGQPIGIGDPLPGSRLFVVDDSARDVAEGVEGRLLIAGPGVCPGYLAEAGGPSPFFEHDDADGVRVAVYDTGDRARRVGDDIVLAGRRDAQVKLRGVRIELGDVEANLLRHADVAQAAALVAREPEPRLVAFVEPRDESGVDEGELRRHLLAWLPPSMLPERWSVGVLPRLANGKIDRASLRASLVEAAAQAASVGDGDDPAERRLARIFDQVLGTRDSDRNAGFFARGGDSLKAHALLAAIEDEYGVELPFAALYAEPTVAGVARSLGSCARSTSTPADDPSAGSRLSAAQRGLWLMQQALPTSTAYNLCYRIDLDGPLDPARVRAALVALVSRHALLRCCIGTRQGEPVLRECDGDVLVLDEIDLCGCDAVERDGALGDALDALARRRLVRDDATLPLHAWSLVRVSAERHVLAFVVHHLVFDGVSASILLDELFDALAGRVPAAPAGRYAGFVARDARYAQSSARDDDLAFWTRRFHGLTAQPAFPLQYHHADGDGLSGARLRVTLGADERARLVALARREDCSLHVLLLTALAAVLDRYEPRADFLVASPFANRRRADERNVVGYFTAVLFYRLQWASGLSLRELAARIRDDTIAALDHQRLPFPELARLLRERLRVLPPGTFRLMFGYHDTRAWHRPGVLDARASEHFGGEAKCDLHLECFDDGVTLELALTHRLAAIDAAAAQDWFDTYREVVGALGDFLPLQPHQWPAPTGAAAARILRAGTGEHVEDAIHCTVPGLFDAAVARYAQCAAIWHEGAETSYAELATRVDALAAHLRRHAAVGEGPVAICMPHQPALLVALLACARCGVPYVPLDPAFPAARIASILEQAGVRLVLAAAGTPFSALPAGIDTLDVGHDVAPGDARITDAAAVTPATLLYVIYTSGSTGIPKGVMVPQRGVANYLLWMQRRFGCGSDTRVLARTSISFDISTWELLLPLIGGGCVVLAAREATESPENLASLVRAARANVLQFVPSGLRLFAEAGMLAQVPGVRQVFCGGEALPRALVERVFDSGYAGELHNLYGPTEASIFMSSHACAAAAPLAAVPIGRPIPNSSLYVLDERLQLLPPNVAGDLYIGGAVLADGYWRDEQRTCDAFIEAPAGLPETRLYRTGDKGRLLSDGSFDYLGRDDQQVKIRGYRVELREIEQHLLAHAGVRHAVAFTRRWGEDDLRLHAAFVAEPGVETAQLAAWLRARLPAWMLPSTLPRIDAVPTLSNGKTDYHRLRALVEEEPPALPAAVATTNRDGIERTVAAIWREVLGHADFDGRSSFFEAGGHSILFLRVRELLRERLDAEFSIADLYKSPNIAGLARAYREKVGGGTVAPLVAKIRERIARRRSHMKHEGD